MRAIETDRGAGIEDQRLSSHAVFVIPRGRGSGFEATVRGHIMELADPSSNRALAPTPDDLYIVSIASDLAWSARSFLRASGLPDDVSVSATWRTPDGARGPADISVTVTVSRRAEALSPALAAAFENSLSGRSPTEPAVHVSFWKE